jgi:hypothetical protein
VVVPRHGTKKEKLSVTIPVGTRAGPPGRRVPYATHSVERPSQYITSLPKTSTEWEPSFALETEFARPTLTSEG